MPKQRTISFAPMSSSTRQTPRRNASNIQDYSQYERIDEPIQNPLRTPKTSTQPTQLDNNKDTQMTDGEEDLEDANDLLLSSREEEIEVQAAKTPTQRNLPSTVTIKRRYLNKRPRKQRDETTWTQFYFDVTPIEDTWINQAKKGKPVLQNRLWTCKLCGPAFSSTDKERHSNTSKLNNHLQSEHEMNRQKHQLGVLPKYKDSKTQEGAMNKFVKAVDPIPTAKEAVLQFFAFTNQPFELIEHKGFKNLYRSVGATCPIESTDVLSVRQEARFNATRRELKVEFKKTCKTFSISFDG
jgi:hypothetical protein